jgi:hypothetical protein
MRAASRLCRNPAIPGMSANRKVRPRPNRVRAKLLERLPTTEGRIAAFDKVHTELAIATEIFEYQGDGGRLGVYKAIGAVFAYFTSRGIPPATLEPIMAITAAISDAERGASSPIFQPARKPNGGSPPTPAMKLTFQGQLAVVAECCVRHCKAEGLRPYLEPAMIMAAKMVNSSNWPITVTATELRELRERVKQCQNRSSPDRIAYDNLISSSAVDVIPIIYANVLLRHDWVIVPGGENSA